MSEGIVMIGDSWESDVEGAHGVGWDAVHFNPKEELREDVWQSVRVLRELLDLPLDM